MGDEETPTEVQSSDEQPTEVQPAKEQAGAVRQQALQQELSELLDVVGPGPLVDLLIERAFQLKATDIHLDPSEKGLRVRLRVDGLLHDVLRLPAAMQSQVVSRVKLLANMDITERRLAQDGHISNATLKVQRDIRVGGGPTINGERLVLRLMPDSESYVTLDTLGMDEWQMNILNEQLNRPYGMILAVGPVGSGKSTTVYSCLELLNDPSKSIVTIEDPVERRIAGINQVQVDNKIDFNFVEALRGVLRQDPNVMMVGEIRDPETAHIAARAGLSGINVLSTLHANDTASTIDVFREFSVPPMFIADSLNCIISQRLLRKVCPNSRETYHPDEKLCEFLDIPFHEANNVELVRGIPSEENFHTGYAGRTGIFEIMVVNDEIRRAIIDGKSHSELQAIAASHGMETLEQAAKRKVREGETSLEEMHRVLTTF